MPDDNSADLCPLVSRNAAGEAFGDALRLYVGRGRRYSVKALSHGSGVKDRIIECAMARPDTEEYRSPPLEVVATLMRFLGPDFTSAWAHVAQQGAFWLPEGDDTPPGMIAAEATEDAATLARKAATGVFGRADHQALQVVGRRMMVRGASLARAA